MQGDDADDDADDDGDGDGDGDDDDDNDDDDLSWPPKSKYLCYFLFSHFLLFHFLSICFTVYAILESRNRKTNGTENANKMAAWQIEETPESSGAGLIVKDVLKTY